MSTCIVCRSKQHYLLYEGILRCSECGHVFADFTPDDSYLWDIYRKDYFFGEEYSNYVAERFKFAVGLDISEDGIRYARERLGVNAYQVDFLQYDCSHRMFDIVCMWDTIEHIRDPHLYIEKISSIVPKDGLLALTTGDIDSLLARLQRDRWRLIHPPTHIH